MRHKFKEKLKNWMKKKISFRFHMTIIMFSTVVLGLISNLVLVNTLGLNHPAIRYPLSIILSYCWFLLFIRFYIRNILLKSKSFNHLDFIDVPLNLSNTPGTSTPETAWTGGGGTFSGGGSSGVWGSSDVVAEVGKEAIKESASSGVAGLVDDEGSAIFVLVVGGVLATLVFGSGAYFIWHSPEILSECLLQVILVSGMRKRMKGFSEKEWIAHMFQVTKWPFVIVLVTSILFGACLRGICPEANNLREYRMKCWRSY